MERAILPKDVLQLDLEQILCTNKHEKEVYRHTKNLVGVALFSRYPARRRYAKKELHRYWGTRIDVHKLKGNGMIYAYIEFKNTRKYFLVATYPHPPFEILPDDEERRKWKT